MIKFENVCYQDGEKKILQNIDFTVNKGDFLSITGSSGGGKSTLIRLCAHMISPSSGKIFYQEKEMFLIDPIHYRREIGYCFQEPFFFGNGVLENLEYPYRVRKEKFNVERVYQLLDIFKMDNDLLKRDVMKLSGGEKQRLALLRSLLLNPKLLLLDEVTSALDQKNTQIIEEGIRKFSKEGLTILWITHDDDLADRISDKRLLVDNGRVEFMEVIK